MEMPKYDEIELFKVFRDFDEDANGFLEFPDYVKCLNSFTALGLTPEEVITLTLIADIDSNGRIDYEEQMKHLNDYVYNIRFHREL